MSKKFASLLVIGFISIFLVACSDEATLDPVSIDENVDSCDTCHMGIKDIGSASQIILKDGTPKRFDDIGCMLTYYQENEENIGKVYVMDYTSSDWIDIEKATFLQNSSFETPMSYGVIAFQSADEAGIFQAENGGEMYEGKEVIKIDVETLKGMGHGEHHD